MEDRTKRIAVVAGLALLISVMFIGIGQQIVANYTSASMPLGNANCSVDFGIIAMKDGVVVNSPILNNPLYLDGIEVDSLGFSVKVRAEGSSVEWSTLSITCVLDVNGLNLNSWDWTILDMTAKNEGWEVSVSHTIDELDYITGATPDWTDADGIGHFEVVATADLYGSVQDTKGNPLSDSVRAVNSWDLTDANEATSEPLQVPSFTTSPSDKTVDYGLPFSFTWVATDDNPGDYKITTYYLDGGSQIVQTGAWTASQQIIYNDDAYFASLSVDPATGEYPAVKVSIVCTVYDDDGQQMFDSVYLTVNPPTEPTSDPITWEKGTIYPSGTVTPKYYEVMGTFKPRTAYTPKDWTLYLNGALVRQGTWNGGDVSFLESLDVKAGVKYTYMLTVTTTAGHSDSYSMTITGETSDIPSRTVDPGDAIVNLPFEIPGLGQGGTLTVLSIIAVFIAVYAYRKWKED